MNCPGTLGNVAVGTGHARESNKIAGMARSYSHLSALFVVTRVYPRQV
jgi:hypothetical protein